MRRVTSGFEMNLTLRTPVDLAGRRFSTPFETVHEPGRLKHSRRTALDPGLSRDDGLGEGTLARRHLLAATTSISIWAPFGSAATPTNVRAGRGFGTISK